MAKKKAQTWFSKAELHEAIHGQNPWWETAKVPAAFVKPYRRSAYYEAVKFEVKYQNQIRDDDLRGLREFREKYGSRVIASRIKNSR